MRAVGLLRPVLVTALLAGGCSLGTGAQPNLSPSATRDPHSPYATTRAEYLLAVKACLEDGGFAVEIDVADGAIYTNEGTDERAQEAAAATRECERTIDPKRLKPPPRLGPDELRDWYIYVVAQVRCLRAAGYATPDPPPEQVFIDGGGFWDPAGKTMEAGGGAVTPDVERRCTQIPERPAFMDW